jgi:hypothetical protein
MAESTSVRGTSNAALQAAQQAAAEAVRPAQSQAPLTPPPLEDSFQAAGQRKGTLSVGSRGAQVSQLQTDLQAKGYFSGPATGYFGQSTQRAVQSLQRDSGINPSGTVGPKTKAALAGDSFQAQPASTPSTHVNTPFIPMRGKTDCYKRSSEMAAAAGAHVRPGLGNGIQVAYKDTRGAVSVNASKAVTGRAYIDRELAAHRPVVVGVDHPGGRHNNGLADHFVTVTGKGSDARGTYYTFNDPASHSRAVGGDTNPANRFYVGANGNLVKSGASSGRVVHRAYSLSWVGRNAEG